MAFLFRSATRNKSGSSSALAAASAAAGGEGAAAELARALHDALQRLEHWHVPLWQHLRATGANASVFSSSAEVSAAPGGPLLATDQLRQLDKVRGH